MSEHAVAQPQRANSLQEATKVPNLLQRREMNQLEPFTLQDWCFDTASGVFVEPRFGYDFSWVPALTGIKRQTPPLLRTQPMVQRFPKDEASVFSSCPNCPEALSPEASTTAESTMGQTPPVTIEATPTPPEVEPTTEEPTPEETAASGLIVEDSAETIGTEQMRRSEFLAQLRTEVTRTAETALSGTGRTTAECPYLDYWFGYYSRQDSLHLERAIRRYAPETAHAATARDYIPIIAERVRRAVKAWARTGEITGVPEGLPTTMPSETPIESGGAAATASGPVMFKARKGGPKAPNDPQAVQTELGEGQPLESGVRSRMESAYGRDFSHVRTHADSEAADLSNRFNALAFTVGNHVAFATNEYKPNTPTGDALIAHELAHVIQQDNNDSAISPLQTGNDGYNSLEQDADTSAAMAVASLWGENRDAVATLTVNALPRLRSGLRLQRCATTSRATTPSAAASSGAPGTPCPTSVTVGAVVQRNHSDLSSTDKERYGTYLSAMTRMDVGPGPDHSGHCMKERLTTISNDCPTAVYFRGGRQTDPCGGDRCLGINQYSPRNFRGLTDSPTAFIDEHKTKIRDQSILEGTGVNSCSVVCEQTYTCDRIHPTTGTFRITRNFRAGTHNRSDGTTMHITTGTVTKTER